MSQTVISGTIPRGIKKAVGEGYTVEFVNAADLGYLPVAGGYKITFDDMPKCDVVCQAWEYDNAVTCVTIGVGYNEIFVTTLDKDGQFYDATFSFMATKYIEADYTWR